MIKVQEGRAAGRRDPDIFRGERIWGEARQRLIAGAAARMRAKHLADALRHAARIDRIAKGVATGDAWDELQQLGLRFAR